MSVPQAEMMIEGSFNGEIIIRNNNFNGEIIMPVNLLLLLNS